MVKKNCFTKRNCAKIGINTDDDLLSNKPIKIPTLTKIVKCVFQGEKLYPQIYLDK